MLGVCYFLFVPSQTGPGFECYGCVIFYLYRHRLVLSLNAMGVSFFICSITDCSWVLNAMGVSFFICSVTDCSWVLNAMGVSFFICSITDWSWV